MRKLLIVAVISGLCAGRSFAQSDSVSGSADTPGAKPAHTRTINVSAGRMLPYNIYGVRDIYPYWGFRYGQQLWGLTPEYSMKFINAKRVNFYSASLSFTSPSTLEGFNYLPFFGFDLHYFSGRTNVSKLKYVASMGFHLGVSPIIEITPRMALRFDFKFNFGPGQSLDVGSGLSASF